MARYSLETKLSPEKAIDEARAYFGENGLGLEIADDDPCCISLVGGGGHVTITAVQGEGKTQVDLETQEWDYQVKEFVSQIA